MKPGALIIATHYFAALNKRARQELEGGTSPAERTRTEGTQRAVEFVSGASTCVQATRNDPGNKSQSNARSFRAMHDYAVPHSAEPAKGSGRTKQPKNWPPEWDAPFERQLTKSQASENHLRDLLALLWPKSPNGLCGNE
jgi:hypothetical protein